MKLLDYNLKDLIGRGAFSEVYRAEKDGLDFAVKILKSPAGVDAGELLKSLRYEFWVLKDLNHPNVVRVHDFGSLPNGTVFLAEEFLDGINLRDFCRNRPFAACEPALMGVIKGLAALHSWKIRHGDLKPENILVVETADGPVAKLLDFGLARRSSVEPGDGALVKSKALTPSASGTPATLAPEIILGLAPDARSDLYSCGVTFYDALTGANPFVRASLDETLNAQIGTVPENIGLTRHDVPPAWQKLITQLMARNPGERPVSARRAADELGGAGFVLSPPPFIGRATEMDRVMTAVHSALATGESLAVTAHGPRGVGVGGFLREVFFRLIANDPTGRDKIRIAASEPYPLAPILLLNRLTPPASHRPFAVTIGALTREEMRAWLKAALGTPFIPENFLTRFMEASIGQPGAAWNILNQLTVSGGIVDASNRVTTASLELADLSAVTSSARATGKDARDFDAATMDARLRLLRRKLRLGDVLWRELEGLAQASAERDERLKRSALVNYLKGAAAIDVGDFSPAREYLNAGLGYLKEEPALKTDFLRARNYLAYIALRSGDAAGAVTAYEEVARELVKLPESEAKSVTNLDLGAAYLEAGRFADALTELTRKYETCTAAGMKTAALSSLYLLAQTRARLGENLPAREAFTAAASLARELGDPAYLLRALNGLGTMAERAGEIEPAIAVYGEALDLALALRDDASAAAAAQNRGVLLKEAGQTESAAGDLELSLKLARQLPSRHGFEQTLACRALTEIGALALKAGRLDEARDRLGEALNLAENEATLKDFRFWILKERCALWLKLKDGERLKADLAIINHAAGEKKERREVVEHLRRESGTLLGNAPGTNELKLANEMRLLLEVTRELIAESTLESLLTKILGHAIDLTRAELGVILLADTNGEPRPVLSQNAELDAELGEFSLSIARKALAADAPVSSFDALQDTEFNQYASVMHLNLRSVLGLPIRFKGKALGVLYLSHRRRAGLFDNHTIEIAQAFADQAGLALKNRELMDFYAKSNDELKENLEHAQIQLERERQKSGEVFEIRLGKDSFPTRSIKMRETLSQAQRLADSGVTVLIHGESGTGKEVLARFVHAESRRGDKAFIGVNCGALPATLAESELFGQVKGAFTGAESDRAGLIEAANGGTLFLDEIADLPPAVQVKLLRVLQERELMRLGETRVRKVDVRLIAASRKVLRDAVAAGNFREDLYYRLAGVELTLPPLRERRDDVPLLAAHFLKLATATQKKPPSLSGKFLKMLANYDWPGNVRELKSVIDVAIALSEGKLITEAVLPRYLHERLTMRARAGKGGEPGAAPGWYDPRKTWDEHELVIYASALNKLEFNAARAAASLGVGSATVYKWLREHKLRDTRDEWRERILPYHEGLKLKDLRAAIFRQASQRHPGHPYRAARELNVAPVTFYRYTRG